MRGSQEDPWTRLGLPAHLAGLDQLDPLLDPPHRHQHQHDRHVRDRVRQHARRVPDLDALGMRGAHVDVVVPHTKGREALDVGSEVGQEISVDLVARLGVSAGQREVGAGTAHLGVHEADRADVRIGNVLEHPLAGRLGVHGVHDDVERRSVEQGHGVRADIAGSAV